MRVNRALLYSGAFLVAIGAVLVAADAGGLDSASLAGVLRLWPIAVIAVGAGLVLRRTRLSLGGGLAAATMPGLLFGSGLAILPRFPGECGVRGEPAFTQVEAGTFAGPATVTLRGGCGLVEVSTQAGAGWRLDVGNTAGRAPVIQADGTTLAVASPRPGRDVLEVGRDHWSLALPTTRVDDLGLSFNAGIGRVSLAGANLGHLDVAANLSAVTIDASAASLDSLAIAVDWSDASITLPAASDLAASVDVEGGHLQVCAPPGLGLRVDTRGPGREVSAEGVRVRDGGAWQSPDYDTAPFHTNLEVEASFGVVDINPIGGCS